MASFESAAAFESSLEVQSARQYRSLFFRVHYSLLQRRLSIWSAPEADINSAVSAVATSPDEASRCLRAVRAVLAATIGREIQAESTAKALRKANDKRQAERPPAVTSAVSYVPLIKWCQAQGSVAELARAGLVAFTNRMIIVGKLFQLDRSIDIFHIDRFSFDDSEDKGLQLSYVKTKTTKHVPFIIPHFHSKSHSNALCFPCHLLYAERLIPGPTAREILPLLPQITEAARRNGKPWPHVGTVFWYLNKYNDFRPMQFSTLASRQRAILTETGLKEIKPSQLRHLAFNFWSELGFENTTLSKVGLWTDNSTSAKYYANKKPLSKPSGPSRSSTAPRQGLQLSAEQAAAVDNTAFIQ